MTEPIWWQTLTDTALLGTDRKVPNLADLPVDLQPNATDVSSESALLRTAALAANYLRAGAEPIHIVLPDLPVCPPETQSYAPTQALKLLQRIMDEGTPNRRLLRFWLLKCVERGWVVPPESVMALLNLGSKTIYADADDDIRQVVGERGRWLSQFNEEWDYVLPQPNPETSWQEGDSINRQIAFRQIRQTDPAKALALLQTSWSTESAKDRVKWMEALRETATIIDESFANHVLTELDTAKKPTAAQRDLRVQTITLLLGLPGSGLFQKTQQALGQYVADERELLIDKVKVLVLPERPDNFFNEKTMASYGFESDAALSSPDQIQQWFYQLIAVLHTSCWTNLFGADYEQIMSVLKRQNWFVGDGITSFAKTIIQHRINEAAKELIGMVSGYQQARLLSLLPQKTLEDRLMSTDELTKGLESYAYLNALGAPGWSLEFSQWVVQELARIIQQQYQLYPSQRLFIADSVLVIHPATVLKQPITTTSDANYQVYVQNTIQKQLVEPLSHWLDLRQQISQL